MRVPILLTVFAVVKSKGKISQNFVAFSEYMNFKSTFQKVHFFKSETKNFDEIAVWWKEKLGRNVPRHSESSVCLVFPLKTKPVLP